MSFYDLTKDIVLSANDLFKYRFKRDTLVPCKGGQKAFEPDDSWIHAKALESFMQERTKILGEQRVEKLKSLVQGVWEREKGLVNLSKPGKFWAHMGFTDKRRNWLYPEEALFLIETNTLEVYHNGLPLSIQEAYNKFIGPDLSLEEYQVFAHLRRLGYVVLRQETQLEITPYEKQINLDKYMTKQNRKERKEKLKAKRKELETESPVEPSNENETQMTENIKVSSHTEDKQTYESYQPQDRYSLENLADSITKSCDSETKDEKQSNKLDQSSQKSSATDHLKRSSSEDKEPNSILSSKKFKSDTEYTKYTCSQSFENKDSVDDAVLADHLDPMWYTDSDWAECLKNKSLKLLSSSSEQAGNGKSSRDKNTDSAAKSGFELKASTTSSKVDQAFPFPTIANKTMLSLPQPFPKLLPPSVEVNEDYNDILIFDVEGYRREHPPKEESKNVQREEERETRIRNLKFSFAEWTQRKPQIKASNWAEYKQRAKDMCTGNAAQTPVDHLWQGPVMPLVRPGDAHSKQSILERLSIIQSADETLLPNLDCVVDLKVSYNVHLPDTRFKKSMPGTPNHRVCVVKCSAEPPNLAEVQEVWSRFKDGVPLLCAVVDSGEIAFYIFDNTFKLEVLS